jgi:signal transduction histidine kinase
MDARIAFPAQARALANFADDPVQKERARQMAEDGTSYVRDYSLPLIDAVRRDDASAHSFATTQEGKRRIDALRADFDRFTATERATSAARQTRADDATQRAIVVATGGLGASIVVIALVGGFLTRAVVLPVRRAAGMAGRLAGGDLAVRMPETGSGEVGQLERAFNTMGRSLEASQDELRQLAEEQAALRRVATLVARAVPASELWSAVVGEVDQLLNPDTTVLLRYEPDGTATVLAARSRLDKEIVVGTNRALEADSLAATVRRTGRAATRHKVTEWGARRSEWGGISSGVAGPVVVEDHLWGVIAAAWTQQEAAPGTEGRIAGFTELVAMAIANADSRAELTASRARVVATADETRRRIERDLHDGTQQRLVHTILSLKLARQALGHDGGSSAQLVDEALQHAESANTQLRELVHGILPAVLRRGGLRAAVGTLTSRAGLPVSAEVTAERLPPALEATAYFIVAEALTNVIKHAGASSAQVRISVDGGALHVEVRDDGVGGTRLEGSSGLLGLRDRAAAMNGELHVESPPGRGTVITAKLPVPDS